MTLSRPEKWAEKIAGTPWPALFGFAASVIAIVPVVLSLLSYAIESVPNPLSWLPPQALLGGLVLAMCLLTFTWIRLRRTSKELKDLRDATSLQGDSIERFEQLISRGLTFCAVEFFPTYRPTSGEEKGPGYTILKKLLGPKIQLREMDVAKVANWENLLTLLVDESCDVIATPLYETRSRLTTVSFTSPLFYADIGLYFRRDAEQWKSGICAGRLTFEAACNLLKQAGSDVRTVTIGDELHEMQTKKYAENAKQTRVKNAGQIYRLIEALYPTSGKKKAASDFLFMERAQAEEYIARVERDNPSLENSVINVLREGELLMPVGFAVRKSDVTLRRFLNLRLLELEDQEVGGLDKLMLDSVNKAFHLNWDDDTIRKNFVRKAIYAGSRFPEGNEEPGSANLGCSSFL